MNKYNLVKDYRFLIGVFAVCLLVLIFALFGKNDGMATATEVTEVPESIREQFDKDVKLNGIYHYTTDDKYYTLLTFGEIVGVGMTVQTDATEDSIYFNVDTRELDSTQPALIYKLFECSTENTDANILKLLNPTYGVGTVGVNVGYVTPNYSTEAHGQAESNGPSESDGESIGTTGVNGINSSKSFNESKAVETDEIPTEFYIAPIEDISIPDRIFKADNNVILTEGLYSFEYEVRDTGTYVTSATPLSDITCFAYIDTFDQENNVADIEVRDAFCGLTTGFTVNTEGLNQHSIEEMINAQSGGYMLNLQLAPIEGGLKIEKAIY